jgi:hypothetical protein
MHTTFYAEDNELKTALGRCRRGWEKTIKMYLQGTGFEGAQNKVHKMALTIKYTFGCNTAANINQVSDCQLLNNILRNT